MTATLILFAAAFLTVVAGLGRRRAGVADGHVWEQAAGELQLSFSPRTLFSERSITGTVGPFSLQVRWLERRRAASFQLVAPLPHSFTAGPAADWRLLPGSVAPRVLTGDAACDQQVGIRGDDDVFPLLDAQTRTQLRDFVRAGGRAGWGKLTLTLSGAGGDRARLVAAARSLLALGERLAGGDLTTRLARMAVSDPIPEVREHSLELLGRRYAASDEAKQAAATLLADADPRVRLVAAGLVPAEQGAPVLRAMVAYPHPDGAVRAAALEGLIAASGYEREREVVAQRLALPELGPRALTLAAVRLAGESGDSTYLGGLCALASSTTNAELLSELAVALGSLGDPLAEPVLLQLLSHDDAQVRLAASRALGLLGTVRAVAPLLVLTKSVLHAEVREAAREAVRRIQERLGEVGTGLLSLTGGEGTDGALSVAVPVSAGGEVSVAQGAGDPAGPPSQARRVKE